MGLVVISTKATHCAECRRRPVVFTRLELCWACYVRLRNKGVCVACRSNMAALGKKGRCETCHAERSEERQTRVRGTAFKALAPRAQTVTPLRGTVEIRSVECVRFLGYVPTATCLAEQRGGCSCDRAVQLERISASGFSIAGRRAE